MLRDPDCHRARLWAAERSLGQRNIGWTSLDISDVAGCSTNLTWFAHHQTRMVSVSAHSAKCMEVPARLFQRIRHNSGVTSTNVLTTATKLDKVTCLVVSTNMAGVAPKYACNCSPGEVEFILLGGASAACVPER